MTEPSPLVSIVTPVYNGEQYLEECIESVLSQTYRDLEYLIVNNCSTDGTRTIAEHYAQLDSRIRVHNCSEFVGPVENHNRALRLISPDCKYCKILSADDFLFPEFTRLTVELADANPEVGIVGTYQLSGSDTEWRVRWAGLPFQKSVISGREVCRNTLLGGRYVFGVPTSTLYRSSLVRGVPGFYPNMRFNADVSSFYEHLQKFDFGFVHQVLSYERVHESAITSTRRKLNTESSDMLWEFFKYGRIYLTEEEFAQRLEELLDQYYRLIAVSVFNLREREFWSYHKKAIEELGYPLFGRRAACAIGLKFLDLMLNPKQTGEKLLRRLRNDGSVSLGDAISD